MKRENRATSLLRILAYRLTSSVMLLLSILVSGQAAAASFTRGLDAFDRGKYKEALHEFAPLAKQGNARAEYRLGIMYAMGLGVARDYAKAVEWLKKSAEQSNASAGNDLGTLYDQGRGVTEDPAEAARWFKKAAVLGHGAAQLNLALLYQSGRGVPQDSVQAFAWASAADALGELRAYKVIDAIGKGLTPEQADKAGKPFRKD
jgi:TPR repeat protein